MFERAAEWIRQRGDFTPDMLREQPALDVLRETLRVLQSGIGSAITEQVPAELVSALDNNAFIFSGFKTYHSLNEVGTSLTKEGKPKSFAEFKKDVQAIDLKYNQNYLYAEYNHAIHSSQMAVKWRDFEEDGDRYDLQYRTANDEKVRAEHQRLNGVTLPPSDPFWTKYLPPNGWNCRCNVVQVRKDKYPRSRSEQALETGDQITAEPKQQMFRFNAGKELKIYPDKHPYYKAPKEVKDTVVELAKEEQPLKERIRDMIAEMPDNLTSQEKTVIAENNIALEKALNITKGKPMSVDKADKQNANPNYGTHKGYGVNCQTCAPAYALRSKGFDITAKCNTAGSKLDYLSRGRAFEVWKNPDGTPATHTAINKWRDKKGYARMTDKRYREFFEEACHEVGIYELSIGWKRGGGHATILQRFDNGELKYIEPQVDNSQGSNYENRNIDYLCKAGVTGKMHNCRGVMRIDNKIFNIDYADIFDK